MEVKGKSVLITGGSAGIGFEAAKQFLLAGAAVMITGRDPLKLEQAKKALPALTAIKSDLANEQDTRLLFEQVSAWGGIDILYNNAGVLGLSSNMGVADSRHLKQAEYEMNVNYLGVIRLNNIFMDMLKSRKESAIINTTSILSYVPSSAEATYSASKAALHFYTQTLRKHLEILKSNVRVFELLPPVVATEMTAARNDKKVSPEEVVKALLAGLRNDRFTIRVGDTKLLYVINRILPEVAFNLVNARADSSRLEPHNFIG